MWEFFGQLLEKGGTTALLFAATFAGFSAALRELWKANTRLQQQFAAQQIAHERAIKLKENEHNVSLKIAAEQFAKRIDELQEKRVVQAQEVTAEIVSHVTQTGRSVDRITVAMETLTEVLRR